MPKLPNKPNPLLKVAPKAPTKLIKTKAPFSTLPMPERLARATDREGLWVRDFVRFPDLLVKYQIPQSQISSEVVEAAHAWHRRWINTWLASYNNIHTQVSDTDGQDE